MPALPLAVREGYFFRKEFLLGYDNVIEDVTDVQEANDCLISRIVPEVLGKLESLDCFLVDSGDMLRMFHEEGLSMAYLPQLIQLTTSPYLKKQMLTQLVSVVFLSIFRS